MYRVGYLVLSINLMKKSGKYGILGPGTYYFVEMFIPEYLIFNL